MTGREKLTTLSGVGRSWVKHAALAVFITCALILIGVTVALLQDGSHGSETPHASTYENASPAQVQDLITCGAVLLDVRTPAEYENSHILGALLLPLAELENARLNESLPETTRIVVYCRSGHRSQVASELLVAQGFTNVYNLVGGYSLGERRISPQLSPRGLTWASEHRILRSSTLTETNSAWRTLSTMS